MKNAAQRKNFNFRPNEKIRYNREIKKIVQDGQRISDGYLTLFWLTRAAPLSSDDKTICRLAIKIDRSFKRAVDRNRMRRWVKEIFRHEKWNLRPNLDIMAKVQNVMEGEPGFQEKKMSYWILRGKFISLCKKAEIWTIKDDDPPDSEAGKNDRQ